MTILTVADYLADLRRSILDIKLAARDLDPAGLAADRVALLAAVKAIENVGEAARNLTRDHPHFAERTQDLISWRRWIAVRNRLVHGYFDLNVRIIWDLIRSNIPALEQALDHIERDASGLQL